MPRRIAHQALVEAHARLLALFAELDGHTQLELPRIVQQQHTERPIVDDTLDELCDPRQELVEIEDRCQLAPDLGERLECLGVLTLPLEQPGMLERDGHERREVAEQRHVHFVEGVLLEPENVERADHPRLVDQRHDECRPHARHQVLVARVPRRRPCSAPGAARPPPSRRALPPLAAERAPQPPAGSRTDRRSVAPDGTRRGDRRQRRRTGAPGPTARGSCRTACRGRGPRSPAARDPTGSVAARARWPWRRVARLV